MIVIDSSAIVAILQEEAEAQRFIEIVSAEDRCVVSAVTVYEAAIVMNFRSGLGGVADVLDFLASSRAEIQPFTEQTIPAAISAYQRFGKGTGARAHLNFGDCVSYALARSLDAPLLFKGKDFAATDIRAAV